ncbi:hypothetical protein B296_00017978 [Ensete ventricosum]|uniref:Uncharacterized protein n=1 Tax=Ensete ventricosum TaxID=4639 RepID=A0A427B385_ENSVE|nr:hypothetical protein B296_00017978 [Ensete ventricosum]
MLKYDLLHLSPHTIIRPTKPIFFPSESQNYNTTSIEFNFLPITAKIATETGGARVAVLLIQRTARRVDWWTAIPIDPLSSIGGTRRLHLRIRLSSRPIQSVEVNSPPSPDRPIIVSGAILRFESFGSSKSLAVLVIRRFFVEVRRFHELRYTFSCSILV